MYYAFVLLFLCLHAEDPILGNDIRIDEYNGTNHFFRIPLLKKDKHVGFIDLDKNRKIIRTSVINENKIYTEEMTLKQIVESAEKLVGKGKMIGGPKLMYEKAETRVGWVIDFEVGNRIYKIMVTPGYSYKLGEK